MVVYFTKSRAAFRKRLPALARAIFPDGGLWIAWPKRASKVPTDMTEDVVREVALPLGLVDNKVCAIDETWSGPAGCLAARESSRPVASCVTLCVAADYGRMESASSRGGRLTGSL